jgi:hypothetical protein
MDREDRTGNVAEQVLAGPEVARLAREGRWKLALPEQRGKRARARTASKSKRNRRKEQGDGCGRDKQRVTRR